MWGGGQYVTFNKTLAGAYINVVSAARANAKLSDRGFAAMPLVLDWGVDGEVFTVTNEDFIYNSRKIFGYDYSHEKMVGLREFFKNGQTLYVYKLNADGVKASNAFATAKFGGIRGNDIKIVIAHNVDDDALFDVKTYLDTALVDTQTVLSVAELVENDFVTFKADAVLAETAGTPLTGGTNGDDVAGAQWQAAIEALESYSFNTFGVISTDNTIKALVKAWVKRMRDEVGVKFQVVAYKHEADYLGVISVENKLVGEEAETGKLVYWVTGAQCACKVQNSLTNTKYDGELNVDVKYTQRQLEDGIKAGKFMFHRDGDDVVVLADINTKVTVTESENADFMSNQTVRVTDQKVNDTAVIWNKNFLGKVPNDEAGRISFWNELVKYNKELERIRAIENFKPEDVVVAKGEGKKQVIVSEAITPTNCMEQLYMTCVIS